MEKTELEEIIKRQRDVIRKKNDIIRSLCEAISNVHEYYNSAEALNGKMSSPIHLMQCISAIQAAISKPVKRKLIDITQYPNEADLDSNNEDHNANGDCSQLTKADKENNSQCMLVGCAYFH
ncbi:hypothetical protein BaOVIS_032860 [Babesia ovis]|uniref:Uncharacterized protein n=1 Tax=Babesia ovis TaxID=5869 RepID=A0A9W5TCS2_BABOV|nr:hypothetical protein BaOVIS_032860 [Babesia ovis]